MECWTDTSSTTVPMADTPLNATMETITVQHSFCAPGRLPVDGGAGFGNPVGLEPIDYRIPVSIETTEMLETYLDFWLTLIVSQIGICNNIIVLVVFVKQGFHDSVNISMTTIAIWDLAKCLAAVMHRLYSPLGLIDTAVGISWKNVGDAICPYFIFFSSYVSGVLAAYVSLERCLCVSMPFKVKQILKPKVTLIACLTISFVVFGSYVVIWWTYDFILIRVSGLYIIRAQHYNRFGYRGVITAYYNYSIAGWPLLSFLIISICTMIIVVQLRKSSIFRSTGAYRTSGKSTPAISNRDRKVIKMLLVILAIYIASLGPRIGFMISEELMKSKEFIYEGLKVKTSYPVERMRKFVSNIITVIDLINSAVNLYVFILMSSSFRGTFMSLFSRCRSVRKTPGPN